MSARPVRRARPQVASPLAPSVTAPTTTTTTTTTVRQRPRPGGLATATTVGASGDNGAVVSGSVVPFSVDAYLQALNGGLSALVVIGGDPDNGPVSTVGSPNTPPSTASIPKEDDDEATAKINRIRTNFALASAMAANWAVLSYAQLNRIQHAASLVKIAVDPSTNSLTTQLVFSIPTRLTPPEDIIQARLLQNAPRLFTPALSMLSTQANRAVMGSVEHNQHLPHMSPLVLEYLLTAVVGSGVALTPESSRVLISLMRALALAEAHQTAGVNERNHYLDGYTRYLAKSIASKPAGTSPSHGGGSKALIHNAAAIVRQGLPLIQDLNLLTTDGGNGPVIQTAHSAAVAASYSGESGYSHTDVDSVLGMHHRLDLGTPNNYYLEEVLEALSGTGGSSSAGTTSAAGGFATAISTTNQNAASNSAASASATSESNVGKGTSKNPASRLIGFMKRGTSTKDVAALNPNGGADGNGGPGNVNRTQSQHHHTSSSYPQQALTNASIHNSNVVLNSSIVKPPQQRGGVYDSEASAALRQAQLTSTLEKGTHNNILRPILDRLALAEQQGSVKELRQECASWRKAAALD